MYWIIIIILLTSHLLSCLENKQKVLPKHMHWKWTVKEPLRNYSFLSWSEVFLICLLNYMTFFYIYSSRFMCQGVPDHFFFFNRTCYWNETEKLYSVAFIPACQMVKWWLGVEKYQQFSCSDNCINKFCDLGTLKWEASSYLKKDLLVACS